LPAPGAGMSELVLVADDDDDILLLVTTRLRRDGFEVVQASSGDEALRLAREKRPRLAVLDIGMPGLDGLEVLEQIRADDELRDMRVLLLTAKAQESDVRRGFDRGADAYVKKPFSPAELSTRVRELLDGGGL
jgi:DNA-binding response OmpR family regulator